MNGILPIIVLTLGIFAYMFWPEKNPFVQRDKTRADYLRERKDVIYDNLRDLNFEYLAGKHPEPDYAEQRAALEDEAAQVVAELEGLTPPTVSRIRTQLPS
ncbi:hypothetical protein HDF16_002520 [Granulicella aggregans]|uniref:C-type cytochrome biogenesis protein CcmI n=1 Tax=Granulicella aggregans TaxID=474949 RepID=A0A7W8E412_9BACT|nr:hypothetical protein [Granulicella aggregans]